MPLCSRNTSGCLGKLTLFISIFQVPSKTPCAFVSTGIDRAASTTRKDNFFIENLHQFEPEFPFWLRVSGQFITSCEFWILRSPVPKSKQHSISRRRAPLY